MTQLNSDNEFGCIEEEMRPMRLTMMAAGEHVRSVEQSNRTIQEGVRRLINKNPYKWYPMAVVEGRVTKSVKDFKPTSILQRNIRYFKSEYADIMGYLCNFRQNKRTKLRRLRTSSSLESPYPTPREQEK